MHARGDGNAACPGREQAEGHGLRIAICELLVTGLRKEQLAPIGRECRECVAFRGQRLGDFIAQQPAQAGADIGQFLGGGRRDGLPAEEEGEQCVQTMTRCELFPRSLDVALKAHQGRGNLAVAPEAELVAVGIDQVRQ